MCLAVPTKILKVTGQDEIVVMSGGLQLTVSGELIDEELFEGDYVLIHAGFILSKLDPDEAAKNLQTFKDWQNSDRE